MDLIRDLWFFVMRVFAAFIGVISRMMNAGFFTPFRKERKP